jgi:glycosyltransferase
MKVSIITVCYNSQETIEDTLLSIQKQDYKDIEYIVVDGASSDGTLAIIDRFSDLVDHVISEPDDGMYDALNKGIAKATGEVVAILNADDMYEHDRVISSVVKAFIQSGADCIYGDLVYVLRDEIDRVTRYWISGKYQDGSFKKGWMPPHPSFFIKREMYALHGVFDTRLKISADYELMLRMMHKHKISSHYIPEVLVRMRTGGISNEHVKSRVTANQEDRLAWKYNDLKPGWLTFVLKPVRKLGQFFIKPT